MESLGLVSYASICGSVQNSLPTPIDWRPPVEILAATTSFFSTKPLLNDIKVIGKINIVGDLHGCLDSLFSALNSGGLPAQDNIWLFNGDFVDRGPYSMQTLEALCQLVMRYPGCVFLNRGNHECPSINMGYGHWQSLDKFGPHKQDVWQACLKLYPCLPLASLVQFPSGMQIFVVHGGICENLSIHNIATVPRVEEPVGNHPVENLLWNSPGEHAKGMMSSVRGAGALWGTEVTYNFLAANHATYIVRSHDSVENGFSLCHYDRVLTIFSASVQCEKPAFLQVTDQPNYQYNFKRSWQVIPITNNA